MKVMSLIKQRKLYITIIYINRERLRASCALIKVTTINI